jgi:hypothetical protein
LKVVRLSFKFISQSLLSTLGILLPKTCILKYFKHIDKENMAICQLLDLITKGFEHEPRAFKDLKN